MKERTRETKMERQRRSVCPERRQTKKDAVLRYLLGAICLVYLILGNSNQQPQKGSRHNGGREEEASLAKKRQMDWFSIQGILAEEGEADKPLVFPSFFSFLVDPSLNIHLDRCTE